jgi:hypothetical protein
MIVECVVNRLFLDRDSLAVERYRLPAAIVSPTPASPIPVVRDYAPRATLVYDHSAPRPVGEAFPIQMPDGRQLAATVRSPVANSNALPLFGNHLGDARFDGQHWYVWLSSVAGGAPSWIDP